MLKPTEDGVDVLAFYDEAGFEVESPEEFNRLLRTAALVVEFGGDGRRVPVGHLVPEEQQIVGAWLNFVAVMSAYQADQFGAATDRIVQAMKATGSETMGDLNNFVKEHGHEKVQQLIDEMEASGPHLKAV